MQKKFIIFIFFIVLVFQFLFTSICYGKSIKYLALGDSIAYGYGLEDIKNNSYSQVVRERLEIDESNYKNLAISGITCRDYYDTIQTKEYREEIQQADLITISIGSNEILKIGIEELSNVTGIDASKEDFFEKVQRCYKEATINKRYDMALKIYDFFNSNECKNKIKNNINVYQEYWDKTVKYIKEINPNALIIATEFYNPYHETRIGDYDLGDFADDAIIKMNEILKERSDHEKEYIIAKIYERFNTDNEKLTNTEADISILKFELNMDPHPNKNGHSVIADEILKIVKPDIKKEIKVDQTLMKSPKQEITKKDNKSQKIIILVITILSFFIIIFVKKYKNKK